MKSNVIKAMAVSIAAISLMMLKPLNADAEYNMINAIDGNYVDSSDGGESFPAERMIGSWYGFDVDNTKSCEITKDTIAGCKYKIIQSNDNGIIAYVYNKQGDVRKYLFSSCTENTMIMRYYDEESKNYVGNILLTRA